MNALKHMVIAKGEIITSKVKHCSYDETTKKYNITYANGSCYPYNRENVIYMSNPLILDPKDYIIVTPEGKRLYDVKWIYQFEDRDIKYWHLVFDGFELDYRKSDLRVVENCLTDEKSDSVFNYLKEISKLSDIPNDAGEIILTKYYGKLTFVPDSSALSAYLNVKRKPNKYHVKNVIFPFGCNQSQHRAVVRALENQISVIQGPPGTGKTQTILNIIANLLINNKSVLVVSNNNSATANILEKFASEKYGMDFLVAKLGSADNKRSFVDGQTGQYPNLSAWIQERATNIWLDKLGEMSKRLERIYQLREEKAILREKYFQVSLEAKHFKEYASDAVECYESIRLRKALPAQKVMRLWQEMQDRADGLGKLSLLFKLKSILTYGIADWRFYDQDLAKIISVLQQMYYDSSIREISERIIACHEELKAGNANYEDQLVNGSLSYLKDYLGRKYRWTEKRRMFSSDELYKDSQSVLDEYPIILSTTFSARASLNASAIQYDYVIMDEASQVDVATGALALSCAKNAVIVGDLKQLPNVVTDTVRQRADFIRSKYNVPSAYDFANNSFLKSIVNAMPSVPMTLLKEHYRCHPRIISFCNQKFYNNELVIMTEDDGSDDTLMAIKTVEGNHARGHYNQRQIDVIKDEILPKLNVPCENIGIIAPYNDQVNEIKKQIPGIDVATVHKFQGREKDIIILTTVDDQIKDFTDDPYLLNVAVSRAKKRLIVVVSGNKQESQGNIMDLVSYIRYNKMEVVDSRVYSVFDFLYSQYREARWQLLKSKKRISEFDSENLTYTMLTNILESYPEYGVQCFEPLSMIVKDLSGLTDDEVKYAMNPATHLDFMIFNKLSKQPLMVIETDGYAYHKKGTMQHERDELKNQILEKCGLKILRLNTNGSNEKRKVLDALGINQAREGTE